MCEPDSKSCSFIVKIWIEETAEKAGQASWRGHITHVGNNERQYLKSLDEISIFIAPYLEEMGVSFDPPFGLRRRLSRWKRYFARKG